MKKIKNKTLIFYITAIIFFFGCIAKATDDIPVYKISQPSFNQSFDNIDEQEEKWLELEWNKWHAKVRNIIYQNNYSKGLLSSETSYAYNFYVDNNQKISNIVVYFFPKETLNAKDNSAGLWWTKENQPFYAYSLEQNVFYELQITKNVKLSKNNLIDVVKSANVVCTLTESKTPRGKKMKNLANNITRLETIFKRALIYPTGSKRTKVLVTALYRHTYGQGSDYTEKDFNDSEKVKIQ